MRAARDHGCSLGLGAVAEPAFAHLLEVPFQAAGLPEELVHPVAFALALAIVVYLHVVIGEMVPKNLAIAGPERAALVLAPPLVAVARVLSPSDQGAGRRRAARCSACCGWSRRTELASAFTAEEVHSIVAESRREGLLDEERARAAHRGARARRPARRGRHGAGRRRSSRCRRRRPRRRSSGWSPAPASAGSRCATTTGTLTGYLHVKDLLFADDEAYSQPVPPRRVRALVNVPADEDVEDVLVALQRAGAHLARVVDPAGSTVGVVFLEDVLEELVGEVRDATQRGRARPARR